MTHSNLAKTAAWHGKPYYSLDAWCKNTLGCKCYKIALNAHLSCPNRDGTLGTGGCIFCSSGGSGDFAVNLSQRSIREQLADGLNLFRSGKFLPDKLSRSPRPGLPGASAAAWEKPCIIAYFQAYTNTYGPLVYLEQIFTQALSAPEVCGISIATRPDCLPQEVLLLLKNLQTCFPEKFIWVELGLQTIHEATAVFIRRGYPLSCFEEAFYKLKALHIPVIVHTILGLPGESMEQILQTMTYLNGCMPFGIKLQLLHILRDTDLADMYLAGSCSVLTKEEYLETAISCLEHLSPDIVIHRVTGDGPKELLLAPKWSLNKRDVLNSLHRLMKEQNRFQGKRFPTER